MIGEAAVKIGQSDPEFVATYHTVPWHDMQTMLQVVPVCAVQAARESM